MVRAPKNHKGLCNFESVVARKRTRRGASEGLGEGDEKGEAQQPKNEGGEEVEVVEEDEDMETADVEEAEVRESGLPWAEVRTLEIATSIDERLVRLLRMFVLHFHGGVRAQRKSGEKAQDPMRLRRPRRTHHHHPPPPSTRSCAL